MKHTKCIALAFAIGILAAQSSATVIFTLDQMVKEARPGQSITFTGKVVNPESSVAWINSAKLTLDQPDGDAWAGTSVDVNLAEIPESLQPGTSWTGIFLTVQLSTSAVNRLHSGNLALLGGADSSAMDRLDEQNFAIQVVPEPLSLVVLVAGVARLARRRRS